MDLKDNLKDIRMSSWPPYLQDEYGPAGSIQTKSSPSPQPALFTPPIHMPVSESRDGAAIFALRSLLDPVYMKWNKVARELGMGSIENLAETSCLDGMYWA